MSEWFFYEMAPEIAEKLDIPQLPFPVRKQSSLSIFQAGTVSLGRILDELDRYLKEQPNLVNTYRETIGKLTWLEAMESGREGFFQHAAHYLRLGLEYRPSNLSLRTEYASVLLCLGFHEEALEEFEYLVNHPRNLLEPLLWILAARLNVMCGNPERAKEILRSLAAQFPEKSTTPTASWAPSAPATT
ncbi:MAG: hypothetical protein JJU29_22015 [Verrucomicrobia bacterium]|nr:hypothetical protein [Verrucomicrobiota bacterium]MCH8514544.1 hypothetical protein [Kiritimatiellia bacterium]